MPISVINLAHGLLTGNRTRAVSAFWNLYGWCIYGVATKD